MERTQLSRPPRGQADVPGCVSVLGVLLAGIGAALALAGWGSEDGSRLVLFSMGATLGAAGLLVIGLAVRAAVGRARIRRLKVERPGEPWLWDHPWTFPLLRVGVLSPLIGGFAGLVVLTVFLLPFNLLAPYPASLIVWVFDALAVCGWGYLVYLLLQAIKYGASYLRLPRLPFFVGETLDVALGGAGRLAGFRTLTVTLRYLEEEKRRVGNKTRWLVFCRHEEVRTLTPDQVPISGRPARLLSFSREADESTELPLSFALPGDPTMGTELWAEVPRYWELEITADTPGIDFKTVFLVPVYARTAEESVSGVSARSRRS